MLQTEHRGFTRTKIGEDPGVDCVQMIEKMIRFLKPYYSFCNDLQVGTSLSPFELEVQVI